MVGNITKAAGPNSSLPLSGLRVVALEQAVAGPFCSRQLADMGAAVFNAKRPEVAVFARQYAGALNGLSPYFACLIAESAASRSI